MLCAVCICCVWYASRSLLAPLRRTRAAWRHSQTPAWAPPSSFTLLTLDCPATAGHAAWPGCPPGQALPWCRQVRCRVAELCLRPADRSFLLPARRCIAPRNIALAQHTTLKDRASHDLDGWAARDSARACTQTNQVLAKVCTRNQPRDADRKGEQAQRALSDRTNQTRQTPWSALGDREERLGAPQRQTSIRCSARPHVRPHTCPVQPMCEADRFWPEVADGCWSLPSATNRVIQGTQ